MNGRYHSREFKLEVVKQVESGEKRPAQICREHKLAESSLLKWRKEYVARGEAAFTPRQPDEPAGDKSGYESKIAELERFCGQLALENSILKKALQKVSSVSNKNTNS
jgi:putative transposase